MPLVSSGVEHGNLRELALARMKDLGTQCRDVRTREVGIQEIHHKVKPYEVSSLPTSDSNSRNDRLSMSRTGVMDYDEAYFMHLTPGVVHNFPKAVGV